jgi:NTP pyrophosphatase (non-canonical NTP hydrolase)
MTSTTYQASTAARPAAPDLREIARHLEAHLRANRRPAITDANQLDVQALCVAEEAGELVGAYRRWAGKARRTGTRRDLEDEVADVLIVTACFAERAGIDLNEAIARKLAVIYSRGWRDDSTAPAGATGGAR